MNRPTPFRHNSAHRYKLAVTLASLFAASSIAPFANACDYCDKGDGGIVCDSACDSCDSACDSCYGNCPGKPAGPVFKALDKFAGGIEKLLGLDKCGSKCDANCDDACDAVMMEELMIPMDSAMTEHYSQPVMPSVPTEEYVQPLDGFNQPPPEYIEPTAPQPAPLRQGDGGIQLSNPFSDDEVRLTPPRSIQTSSRRNASTHVQPSRSISRYLNAAPAKHHTSVRQAHQHQTKHVHQAPTRRHATHQHGADQHQLQLLKAPAPKQLTSMVRKTSAQSETAAAVDSSRRTTKPATTDYFAR